VNAVRTARGLDVASPTGLAIVADLSRRAQQGIDTVRLNAASDVASYRARAAIAGANATSSIIGGFSSGMRSLFTKG
jgi:hypothetical protein